jgi:hypothetical protein
MITHGDLPREECSDIRKLFKPLLKGGEAPDEVPEADQATVMGEGHDPANGCNSDWT